VDVYAGAIVLVFVTTAGNISAAFQPLPRLAVACRPARVDRTRTLNAGSRARRYVTV